MSWENVRLCREHFELTASVVVGPVDKWAYHFGAICPAKGKGAGLVMPWCDTHAMEAHLAEISTVVDPAAHAVVIVDQAGWRMSPKLNLSSRRC